MFTGAGTGNAAQAHLRPGAECLHIVHHNIVVEERPGIAEINMGGVEERTRVGQRTVCRYHAVAGNVMLNELVEVHDAERIGEGLFSDGNANHQLLVAVDRFARLNEDRVEQGRDRINWHIGDDFVVRNRALQRRCDSDEKIRQDRSRG